jgi:hypothetical protein
LLGFIQYVVGELAASVIRYTHENWMTSNKRLAQEAAEDIYKLIICQYDLMLSSSTARAASARGRRRVCAVHAVRYTRDERYKHPQGELDFDLKGSYMLSCEVNQGNNIGSANTCTRSQHAHHNRITRLALLTASKPRAPNAQIKHNAINSSFA